MLIYKGRGFPIWPLNWYNQGKIIQYPIIEKFKRLTYWYLRQRKLFAVKYYENFIWTSTKVSHMFTRYSSSIFSFNFLAVFPFSVIRHKTLHICGSRILNCNRTSLSNPSPNILQSKMNMESSQHTHIYIYRIYLIRGVLNTITAKNFSKIFCTVYYGLGPTEWESVVGVRKLCFGGSQFVHFHIQRVSLHSINQRNCQFSKETSRTCGSINQIPYKTT